MHAIIRCHPKKRALHGNESSLCCFAVALSVPCDYRLLFKIVSVREWKEQQTSYAWGLVVKTCFLARSLFCRQVKEKHGDRRPNEKNRTKYHRIQSRNLRGPFDGNLEHDKM